MSGSSVCSVCPCAPECPVCLPCVSRLPPVSFYRIKNNGGSRDKTSQVKSNLFLDRARESSKQTIRQTIRHSPEIMKPKDQAVGGGGGDGGGYGAQTREQRGREPDRNGDGTPQCTGRQNLPWRCASPVRLPPPRSSARVVAACASLRPCRDAAHASGRVRNRDVS